MPDKHIFHSVVALLTVGTLATYSLTPFLMVRFEANEYTFVLKQLIFSTLAIMLMWAISRLESRDWLHRIGMLMFVGGLFAMILMNFLPTSIVPEIGGASRWISIMGFSLAPVEFFKIGFVYFIAWSMSRKVEIDKNHKLRSEFSIFFPYFIIFIIAIFFIAYLQKDLGQSVVLGATLVVLSYLAGGSGKFIAKTIGFLTIVFLFFIMTFSHRTDRIQSWWLMAKTWLPDWIMDRFDLSGGVESYQIAHSLNAVNNGGIFGTGIGGGIYKYGYLAEVHTDFVLEGIAEETGLASILLIFLIFTWLFQRMLKVANRSEDRSHFLFSIGMALIIVFGLLINAYGATGIIPMKGIPVPFISYGGSSLLALSIGIGMVLMISRDANRRDMDQETELKKEPETKQPINQNYANYYNNSYATYTTVETEHHDKYNEYSHINRDQFRNQRFKNF